MHISLALKCVIVYLYCSVYKFHIIDIIYRFTVNLRTGHCGIDWFDGESDHTLHISVRFKINTVVRNVYQDNAWGTEERNGPFPFAIGRAFTMVIAVERTAYKVRNIFIFNIIMNL